MVTADKTLTCRDCGQAFIFTQGEQAFYERKGYVHIPGRCPTCRQAKRLQGGEGQKEYCEVVCAQCEATCRVPFRPVQGRPVYCSLCYRDIEAQS